MILVTGATGHFGKAVIEFLVSKTSPSNIAALVRDTTRAADVKELGVELRTGDYLDYASLVKAFKGIDKLLFVSGSDIATRMEQHTNVVNAAKEAGVKHVIYTSFQRSNETETSPLAPVAKSHIHTEKLLKASGLVYTFMKNTLYTEYIPIFIGGEHVLQTGTIYHVAGNGKVPYASRLDMAEAASVLLTTAGHENKSYEICGPVAYSYADIAAIITELSGKKITYVSLEHDAFRKGLTDAGVPEEAINISLIFGESIRQNEFDIPDTFLEKLLGRKITSPKDFLKTVYGK